MKKAYYISRNYKALFDASGKAKTDCEYALRNMGFKNLGFKQTNYTSSAVGTIINFFGITWALLRLPFKSTLCTQYPLNKFYTYITFIAKLKRCKVIAIVHDVRSLKGRVKNVAKELSKISNSAALIVHNPSMKQWFVDQGFKMPIHVVGIFDYINEGEAPTQNENKGAIEQHEIVYAGGLGQGKNSYLYDFDTLENPSFKVKLYGLGFNEELVSKTKTIISYQGAFPSNEIAYKIEGSFGLVWDGNSLEECSGPYGQYLRYNNPHKTSLYILCGLPIIIWDQAALSDFVVDNNIGVRVSSLKELDTILANLTDAQYQQMVANVFEVRKKLMTGGFLTTAMKGALASI